MLVLSILLLSGVGVPVLSQDAPPAFLPRDGSSAETAGSLELVGQLGGHMTCIALHGGYAYVGFGPRMIVIDVSDPSHPTRVGETPLLPGVVNGIAIAGDYAYLAVSKSGLIVFSLADAIAPQQVGSCPTPGDANQVAVAGGYAYVADGHIGGLRIIDIGDPAHPVEVGFLAEESSSGRALDVAVAGTYAFVADGNCRLRVVDVSHPAAPTQVTYYDGAGLGYGNMQRLSSVAIEGTYLYGLDTDAFEPVSTLWIVNVADPGHPRVVGVASNLSDGREVAVAGNRALVASSSRLHIIDVTDKSNPHEIAAYHPPDAAAIAVGESFVYVAGEGDLHVVDIANLAAPAEVGSCACAGPVANGVRLAIAGAYAYVVNRASSITEQGWNGGWLTIVSLADPTLPAQMASVDTPGEAWEIAAAGHYAYVADGRRGVTVYDVSTPNAPVQVATMPELGEMKSIAISGQYAFAVGPASPYGMVRILNISDPSAPVLASTLAGTADLPVNTSVAVISDDRLYLTAKGLSIVDISDPTHPILAGHLDAGSTAGLAARGRYAYLASYSSVSVVDVGDPSRPVVVDVRQMSLALPRLWLAGDWLYVSSGQGLGLVKI